MPLLLGCVDGKTPEGKAGAVGAGDAEDAVDAGHKKSIA